MSTSFDKIVERIKQKDHLELAQMLQKANSFDSSKAIPFITHLDINSLEDGKMTLRKLEETCAELLLALSVLKGRASPTQPESKVIYSQMLETFDKEIYAKLISFNEYFLPKFENKLLP